MGVWKSNCITGCIVLILDRYTFDIDWNDQEQINVNART